LLADDSLTGSAWCRAHSDLVDAWLAALLDHSAPDQQGFALVAVGGYGRSELCPQSDIDVILLHDRRRDASRVADGVWYPVWDGGLHVGHSVATVREVLNLAADDLDTATSVLSARLVAGDGALAAELAAGGLDQWTRRSKRWLTELGRRTELRHEKAGEVAFHLEPDLKEGRGGLRDVHGLKWAEAARSVLLEHDAAGLEGAYEVLLDARVELQRHTGRSNNQMVLQDQDAVAAALGDGDADALMARIAEASRLIAWTSDDTWRRIRSAGRRPRGPVKPGNGPLVEGIHLKDGEVHLDDGVDPAADATLALRVALQAAMQRTVIDRDTLERLADRTPPFGDPWPPPAAGLLADLLLCGRAAIPVIEALDQRNVWTRILPEWAPVRSLPQRNAYHRFTVDRHLLETAANAAALVSTVERPDLLVVTALMHDLGKGYEGDHTQVGAELAGRVARRVGYPDQDVDTIASLIRNHLLLSEVATRRDLDDSTTIEQVASAVGTVARLRLLAALTEADSLATGSSAWGPWKAELLGQLVDRTVCLLGGGQPGTVGGDVFPTPDQLDRLAAGGQRIETSGSQLTVMSDDRPGIFSRIAGVLALHGLDVLAAAAHSTDSGRALAEFRVTNPFRPEIPWDRVAADLDLALNGRLALNARLAERARTYAGSRPQPTELRPPSVHFDQSASTDATVIDVQTRDGIGVLARITRALADLDLDIRSARVQTLGADVVDAFYVRDATGHKVTDPHIVGEIRRSILHALSE